VANVLWTGHQQGFVVRVASTDDAHGFAPTTLVVRAPSLPAVLAGDDVTARGLWLRDDRGAHLQAVSVQRVAREAGARGFAWRAIDGLESYREVGSALLLGRGDPPEKDLFRRTGLIHLLAVSGMHLALAAALGAWLLRQCGIAWHVRQLALGGLLIGYTWLTAASPATVRALAMALALLLYGVLAREPHRLGAVSLAALALILWDPAMARDLGFQLSLVAVLGLLTLGLDLVRWRERVWPLAPLPLDRPTWRGLLFMARSSLDGLAIGIAATLATLPLLAGTFGTISPWSALTTLLAAPPSTLALWSGLPMITLAGIWPNGPWEGLYLVVESCLSAFVGAVPIADLLPGRIPWPVAPWWVLTMWPLLFVPTLRSGVDGVPAVPWPLLARLVGAVALFCAWAWFG
jgi:competence protein ComEC